MELGYYSIWGFVQCNSKDVRRNGIKNVIKEQGQDSIGIAQLLVETAKNTENLISINALEFYGFDTVI